MQYKQFNKISLDYVNSPKHREEFAPLGMMMADFGTHLDHSVPVHCIDLSSISTLTGGCPAFSTGAPSTRTPASSSRAGASRDAAKTAKIGASCAYWDFSADAPDAKAAFEKRLQTFLRESLPAQARDNLKIYAVYKIALVAIANYRDCLAEHFYVNSISRTTPLCNIGIPAVENKVVVKYLWDDTDDPPEITGLLSDTVLLAEIESMKNETVELKTNFSKSSFESTPIKRLNQHEISGSGFTRGNEIVAKLEALIEKVSEVSRKTQTSPALLAPPPLDGDSH